MLGDIQTLGFFFHAGTKTDGIFQNGKSNNHGKADPCNDGDDTDTLNQEIMNASAVEEAAVDSEEAG